jgi:hypothetical protein
MNPHQLRTRRNALRFAPCVTGFDYQGAAGVGM